MDPNKEILNQFEQLKNNFDTVSQSWKTNSKLNIRNIVKREYEKLLNQLMNFYNELIQKPKNISFILRANLDLQCWNLLTERSSTVIKLPIDRNHLGKNSQVIIQNLYSTLLDDLRNSFDFFKNVYTTITEQNYLFTPEIRESKDFPIFISNVLTFMGDIKKLKLMLNKKFLQFKELINIEGDFKKDANDGVGFFNYALDNNPRNARVYSNLGYIYREFLEDYMSSAYWFIRALSCIDNEMTKIKDNLEKDFESIRGKFNKNDYMVDTNVNNISFLKYDIDYLPILFYRNIGILYMNIDIDDIGRLEENFKIIMSRVLLNYHIIPDEFKINYEVKGNITKMIILSLFTLHYNLNNLEQYKNESQEITFSDRNRLLNFKIYNHNLIKSLNQKEMKQSLKYSLNFLITFTKIICSNMREKNYNFIEKYLLVLFYWLSLNYDCLKLFIDEPIKNNLKYLHYYLRNETELKKYLFPKTRVTLDLLINNINNLILPIELSFLGFIPLHRFFQLNKKKGIFKIGDIKEISIMNKIILIHFLECFGFPAINNQEISNTFHSKGTPINITKIEDLKENIFDDETNSIIGKLNEKNIINIPVEKKKPLIILDASNIAMRHGDQKFSTKGIQIAMDFFNKNGHDVISFLPEYFFRQKDPNSIINKKRVIPDNVEYLNELYKKHLVIQSPPQDYDDSYCIQYAKTHDSFIVTNDLFRDYLEKITDNRKRETERIWIKERSISFTFNQDEFIPNPDATFFKNYDINEYNKMIK